MSYREREGKPYCDYCYTGGLFSCFCDIVIKVCLIFMSCGIVILDIVAFAVIAIFRGLSASKTKKSTMVTLHWCRKVLQWFNA